MDVITCAAPNLRLQPSNYMNPGHGTPVRLTREQIRTLHLQRARKILSVAAIHGAEVLILGAFGCGAFCNPPEVVAGAFRDVLPDSLPTPSELWSLQSIAHPGMIPTTAPSGRF